MDEKGKGQQPQGQAVNIDRVLQVIGELYLENRLLRKHAIQQANELAELRASRGKEGGCHGGK